MVWFLRDLNRLTLERAAVEKLQATAPWLKATSWGLEGSALRLDADIEAHGFIYPVRMIYPDTFPASPPTVFPREKEALWSTHQYGPGGELCLEWGPDTWMPEVTGEQMLSSAYDLLSTENPKGRAESEQPIQASSRHALTDGQEMRWNVYRFLATPQLREYFTLLPQYATGEIYALALLWQQRTVTAIVSELRPEGKEIWTDSLIPQRLENYSVKWRGLFLKSTLPSASLEFETVEELRASLQGEEDFLPKLDMALGAHEIFRLLLIQDVSGGLHLFRIPSETTKLIRFKSLNLAVTNQWERLGQNFNTLSSKRAGIVGLGSAGSKIAIALARSGVNRFLLVDDDLFLPENICRHTLDWRNVGEHKVVAVEDQLALISSMIEVDVRRLRLTGQESTASVAGALQALANCDVIIDATADSGTFNQLAMVAVQYQRPFVWFEVYAGGIGGQVARYRPGYENNPFLMRERYNAFTAETNVPSHIKTIPYGLAQADGSMIASDADVAVIANHAARFALDTLAEREPSAFPYAMYLIGLSRGWIFEQPFQTIPIDTGPVTTPITPDIPPEVIQESVDFFRELLEAVENEGAAAH